MLGLVQPRLVVSVHLMQVARSVEYVQSGTTALQDAKTLQKKTRKWMCCAIILLLVTAAVIVIVVSIADGPFCKVWHCERNIDLMGHPSKQALLT